MRSVVREFLGEYAGRGQKSGVPAHDYGNINAGKAPVVEVDARESEADKPSGRAETGTMVGHPKVVVDGFGDMHHTQFITRFLCIVIDDPAGVGRVVAADIIEIAHVVGLDDLENFIAIFFVRFIASREHCRRRRSRHHFEVVRRSLGKIEELFVYDAPNAIDGAIDVFDA